MTETDKSVADIREKIKAVIRQRLDLHRFRAFFFGSRVTGKARDRSDFDVGLLGSEPVDEETLRHIREDMDNLRTLYKIDVVDFAHVKPDFRDVALAHVEEIK